MKHKETILITGASGLTGQDLISRICNSSYYLDKNLILTVHRDKPKTTPDTDSIKLAYSIDLTRTSSWVQLIELYRPDSILVISNIRHSKALLSAISLTSDSSYLPRLIIVGTTGVYSCYNMYSDEYKLIEKQISCYNGSVLLLRPSMIYGASRDKNIHKVIDFVSKWGFFIVFGSGMSLVQPVYYKDLSWLLFQSLILPSLSGSYDAPGKYAITYHEMLQTIFDALQKPFRVIKIPVFFAKLMAFLLDRIPWISPPFSVEQVERIQEDKIFAYHTTQAMFCYNPTSFDAGIKLQVSSKSNERPY
jgi:dTDP-4-dehydrorhamnose reductase